MTYHFAQRGLDSGGALVGFGMLVGLLFVVDWDVVVVFWGRRPPGGLHLLGLGHRCV